VKLARPADWSDMATHRVAVILRTAGQIEDRLDHALANSAAQVQQLEAVSRETARQRQQLVELAGKLAQFVVWAQRAMNEQATSLANQHTSSMDQLRRAEMVLGTAGEALEYTIKQLGADSEHLKLNRAAAAEELRQLHTMRGARKPWWRRVLGE
jgi:Na+/phosphate symporter